MTHGSSCLFAILGVLGAVGAGAADEPLPDEAFLEFLGSVPEDEADAGFFEFLAQLPAAQPEPPPPPADPENADAPR